MFRSTFGFLCALMVAAYSQAATRYVNAARSDDAGDGLGWASAKRTIQATLDAATDGDSIIVTNGVYAPIDSAGKAVAISSVNGAAMTVIDGGRTNRCAKLCAEVSVTNTVLAGFTLRNGWADDGAGSYGGILSNCVLTGNVAVYSGGGALGGSLEACTLTGNSAEYGGGASGGTLNRCLLADNLALRGGGANMSTLNNCIVWRNTALSEGGGIWGGVLRNCTVSGNTSSRGSGIFLVDGFFPFRYESTADNCIIWENRNYAGGLDNQCGWAAHGEALWYSTIRYSCIAPLELGEVHFDPDQEPRNTDADPMFVDAGSGDFRLRSGSPCVDDGAYIGNVDSVGPFDFAGNPRLLGITFDQGAYEGVVEGYIIAVRVQGHGVVSPGVAQGVPPGAGGECTFAAESGPAAFRCFLTNGVFASASPTFTWRGIMSDGTLTAVFDSADWFVDAARPDDSGDGLNWAGAKRTIQGAINETYSGDTVWVTNGIYDAVLITGRSIAILSVSGAAATIIDGGGVRRCVSIALGASSSLTNTVLTGLTLRHGAADSDGGGSLGGSLSHCVLSGNAAFGGNGGGVCFGVLDDCTLSNNTAAAGGAAAASTLNHCRVTDNAASGNGGGTKECVLRNCVIGGNSAAMAGGGDWHSSLENCTVAGNTAAEGGGVLGSELGNCIVWGNQAPAGTNYASSAEFGCTFAYCCTAPLPEGEGNISSNPLLVNPAREDFRLSLQSPCINAGTNAWVTGATDVEGLARIIDGIVDMGAHEALPISLALNCLNLRWTSGGDAMWFGQGLVSTDGEGAMQSGPLGDAQGSWIEAATEGKGTLQFAWRVSSESRDYLRFYKDGLPGGALSGTPGWLTVTLGVTNAGAHTFRWEYVKGKSEAGGADAGWLDQVVWTATRVSVAVAASPAVGGVVTGGGVYPAGVNITLVAAPNRGWRFSQWESGETNVRRVLLVPDAACTCTAYFVQDAIRLAEALDAPALTWSASGNEAWRGWVMDSAYDGDDAAQSGVIGDDASSRVQTTVAGAGTLSFWWRVSCEEDYDYLDVDVDGQTADWLTGDSGWRQAVLRVGAGTHTVAWEYWKDESQSAGEDAAWLDQVTWVPDALPLSGFSRWASNKGLAGDLDVLFGQDRNGDGVANGFEYAYGTNLAAGDMLLNIRVVGAHRMVEVPWRDPDSTDDVAVTLQGCSDLCSDAWTLPVGPAVETTGKPAGRDWFETQGEPAPSNAFFRLQAVRK